MSKKTPGGANIRARKAAKEKYLAERARHRERVKRREAND